MGCYNIGKFFARLAAPLEGLSFMKLVRRLFYIESSNLRVKSRNRKVPLTFFSKIIQREAEFCKPIRSWQMCSTVNRRAINGGLHFEWKCFETSGIKLRCRNPRYQLMQGPCKIRVYDASQQKLWQYKLITKELHEKKDYLPHLWITKLRAEKTGTPLKISPYYHVSGICVTNETGFRFDDRIY
jgi:hypothetical protein